MRRWRAGILFSVVWALAGCVAAAPSWRARVAPLVEAIGREDAPRLFPQEYRSLLETFEHGEAVYQVTRDHTLADSYYQMAFQKGELLQAELQRARQRLADEQRQRAVELAEQAAEEKLMREAAEAEQRLREQEQAQVELEARAKAEAQSRRTHKEPIAVLPGSYTVRRGETLPQIAGRPEIYNNSTLWPIIYRANRDQIRDPKRLWPGQVLTIPRHFNR